MQNTRPTEPRPRPRTERANSEFSRTTLLLWISFVGFAWLALLALVVVFPWESANRHHHWGLILATAAVAFGTFAPVESHLRVHGLTVRGVFGLVLLTHVAVYVPAPTHSILSLAEIPVFGIVGIALLYTIGSLAMPILFVVGKQLFHRRSRRYDVRRAWRQATELGTLVMGCVVLIGLRAFTPMLAGLWVLMVLFAEYIFLSYIEPPIER